MKILHLFSDWKWTGPAEPVLNLCKELEKRGHDVTLGYRKPPIPTADSLEKRVLDSGIKATTDFHLNHVLKANPPSWARDAFRDCLGLKRYFDREKFDILNVHHSHDHVLGGLAARRGRFPTVVVRTDHKRNSIRLSLGNRLVMSRLTDGILTFSERARKEDIENFRLPPERVVRIPTALPLERYTEPGKYRDMRAHFGIAPADVVIGMVARFQKYRRTDVLLEAMREVVKEFPGIKLLLVGRSGQMEESVVQPIKRLGIEPWVILAGYRTDDYLDTLSCMDLFVFLMAGSDGTARALREAMSLGKPVVVSNQGMLPELVDNGVSGLVVNLDPAELGSAVLQLLRDPEMRKAMGKASYEKAHREFHLGRQADAVEEFYRNMIRIGRWGGS